MIVKKFNIFKKLLLETKNSDSSDLYSQVKDYVDVDIIDNFIQKLNIIKDIFFEDSDIKVDVDIANGYTTDFIISNTNLEMHIEDDWESEEDGSLCVKLPYIVDSGLSTIYQPPIRKCFSINWTPVDTMGGFDSEILINQLNNIKSKLPTRLNNTNDQSDPIEYPKSYDTNDTKEGKYSISFKSVKLSKISEEYHLPFSELVPIIINKEGNIFEKTFLYEIEGEDVFLDGISAPYVSDSNDIKSMILKKLLILINSYFDYHGIDYEFSKKDLSNINIRKI